MTREQRIALERAKDKTPSNDFFLWLMAIGVIGIWVTTLVIKSFP